MFEYNFSIDKPISYHWSGKFKAPSGDWIHSTRQINDYEIFLVTDGTLSIADHQNKYLVRKNEYLIMSPTDNQYGYAPSDCCFFWMHFLPSSKDQEAQNQIILPRQGTIPNPDRMIILFNQIRDADRRYHHRFTNDTFLTGFLLELYNQIQSQQKELSASSQETLYNAIKDYIFFNRFNRITVTELSQYFGYHEKYLSSVFKNHSGISLKQYLLQVIMEHAKAELMDTNQSIAQIGSSIGYSDSHNFSHAFKNVVGITPTEYRINCLKIPKTPS